MHADVIVSVDGPFVRIERNTDADPDVTRSADGSAFVVCGASNGGSVAYGLASYRGDAYEVRLPDDAPVDWSLPPGVDRHGRVLRWEEPPWHGVRVAPMSDGGALVWAQAPRALGALDQEWWILLDHVDPAFERAASRVLRRVLAWASPGDTLRVVTPGAPIRAAGPVERMGHLRFDFDVVLDLGLVLDTVEVLGDPDRSRRIVLLTGRPRPDLPGVDRIDVGPGGCATGPCADGVPFAGPARMVGLDLGGVLVPALTDGPRVVRVSAPPEPIDGLPWESHPIGWSDELGRAWAGACR